MKITHSTRRFIGKLLIFFITTIPLIIIYAFFIFPARTTELNKRGFRILSRIEKNFQEKKTHYQHNIDSIYSKLYCEDSAFARRLDTALVPLIESKHDVQNPITTEGKIKYREGKDHLEIDLDKQYYQKTNLNGPHLKFNEKTSKWELRFHGKVKGTICKTNTSINPKTKLIEYRYDFESFVEPLLNYRKDFFEDFIIYSDSALIYQTKDLSFGHNILEDTSFLKSAILSGQIIKSTLSGEKYIAFVSPFSKTDGLNLTICGIVPNQEFMHDGMMINNQEGAIILMLLMILFFSMPMIKIFTIARFERFDKKDVFSMIISLVMICLIITTYSFTHIWRKGMAIWNDEYVKILNDTIKTRFEDEHMQRINDLVKADSLLAQDFSFRQWFLASSKKRIFSEGGPVSSMSSLTENFFIIDSLGKLKAVWQRKPDKIPRINLSDRKYFKMIAIPNRLPYYNNKAGKYFFDTQINYQKNNYSVVFSKQIKAPYADKDILAIEGRFYSLMNTAMPNEYGFCVIDQHGTVLFHSEETRNRKENFIEECNNNQILKTVISNQSSSALDLTFYGKHYHAYIQPLNKNLPLFLITFKNLQYDHNSSLDIILYTLFICTSVLLVLLLISGLHYIIFSKPSLLHGHRWSFNFLDDNDFNKKIALQLLSFLIPLSIYTILVSSQFYGTDLLYITFIMPLWIPVYVGLILEKRHKETFQKIDIPVPFEKKILKKYAGLKWVSMIALLSINIFQLYYYSSIAILFGFLLPLAPFLYHLFPKISKIKNHNHKLHLSIPGKLGNLWKLVMFTWLLFIILIIFHATESDELILIYTLFLILIASSLYYIAMKKLQALSFLKKFHERKNISTLYSFVILLIILNIGIIPSLNSVRESTVHEYYITNKRRDVEIAEKYLQRKTNFKIDNIAQDTSLDTKGMYLPGYVCKTTDTDTISCISNFPSNKNTINELNITSDTTANFHKSQLYKLILNFIHTSQEYHYQKRLQSDSSNKETPYSWSLEDNSIRFQYDRQLFNSETRNNLFLSVIHPLHFFRLKESYKEIFLQIIFLVMFYTGVYHIIRKLHIKIKLLKYFQASNFPTDDLKNQLKSICREKRKTILLTIPGSYEESDVVNMVKEILSELYPEKDINLTPYSKFNAYESSILPICIVFNFRFQPDNLFKEDKDQERFISMLKDEKYTIIYFAHQYPFTDLNNFIINPRGAKTNIPDDIPSSNIKFYSALVEIFGNYKKIILTTPKIKTEWPEFDVSKLNTTQFPYLCSILSKELEFLNFPAGIKESIEIKANQYISECLIKVMKDNGSIYSTKETLIPSVTEVQYLGVHEKQLFHYFPRINEELILEIQSISYNHYISIWRSLTSPEKLVLFELASDMIINHKNLDILILLKDKGVIQYCNEQKFLKVFNRSFKNFILSEVTSEEIDVIERDLKIKHTWDNTKSALIIFFLIVGIFMFITQPEPTKRITGFLISFISIIPLIHEIFQGGITQKK